MYKNKTRKGLVNEFLLCCTSATFPFFIPHNRKLNSDLTASLNNCDLLKTISKSSGIEEDCTVPDLSSYKFIALCVNCTGEHLNTPCLVVPYSLFKLRGLSGYGFNNAYISTSKTAVLSVALEYLSDTLVNVYVCSEGYPFSGVSIYGIK